MRGDTNIGVYWIDRIAYKIGENYEQQSHLSIKKLRIRIVKLTILAN